MSQTTRFGVEMAAFGKNTVAFVYIDGGEKQFAQSFSGVENVSKIPKYTLNLGETLDGIADYLGKEVKITLPDQTYNEAVKPRTFEGIVTDAEVISDIKNAINENSSTSLTVRPFLTLLEYSSHSCIYQNLDSIEILKAVLERNGLSRKTLKCSASPPKRETCVQYNENDLEFVQRVLAEDGIVFWFHDGSEGSALVLHDTAKPYPSNTTGDAELTDAGGTADGIFEATQLALGQHIVPGQVSLSSYAAAEAAQGLSGSISAAENDVFGTSGITEYRASRAGSIKADGDIFARQLRGAQKRLEGDTEHPGLFLGQGLALPKVDDADIKGDYLISSLKFHAKNGGLETRFHAAIKDAPFWPISRPKPLIAGVHNALVVGGDDGTSICDAEGRVKVKFFWDLSEETTDTSGWIPVAETYAGKGYGGQFIPRVGHEVLVSFLHGDPDCPVITGQIYNANNPLPFAEENTTKSGFTSKLEEDKQNKLLFDDAKGEELLALSAAKDYELVVADTATLTVEKDKITTVKGTNNLTVEKTYDVVVTESLTVGADTINISGKSKIKLEVGSSSIEISSSGIKINATAITIESTNLVAKGSADFKLSGAKGDITASGVLSLEAKQLTAEGKVQTALKGGAKVSVEASGMVEVKGKMVKIN